MGARLGVLITASLALCAGTGHAQPEIALVADRSQAPCGRAASLGGDSSLREELGRHLLLLGISTTNGGRCEAIRVGIERHEGGYRVSLEEQGGRRVTRDLSDLRMAATWIDSWMHQDLVAPLLAMRILPPGIASPESQASLTSEDRWVGPHAEERVWARGWQVAAGYASMTVDGAPWRGLVVEACRALGPVCVGTGVRASTSDGTSFTVGGASEFSHESVSAEIQVGLPLALARVQIRPYLGLGASWLRTDAVIAGACVPSPNPSPDCFVDVPGDLKSRESSWAPTADAGISVLVPLASSVRLRLGGSLGLRWWGRSAIFFHPSPVDVGPGPGQGSDGSIGPGNGGAPCDNTNSPPCVPPQPPGPAPSEGAPQVLNPADPSRFFSLTIGVEVAL